MKLLISVSVLVFGSLGGWLGSLMDSGNMFGGWSILGTIIGSIFGIWMGVKAVNAWLE